MLVYVFRTAWLVIVLIAPLAGQNLQWRHLSSANDDLAVPVQGTQQTCAAVFDVNGDGINDFVIAERTAAPSVVWYERTSTGWRRHVLEPQPLQIEAGCTSWDVDQDGDMDFVAGGDARSPEVWWWENPRPKQPVTSAWTRRLIKKTGQTKHHDLAFGDVDGDGSAELVFWNQNGKALYVCDVPGKEVLPWPCQMIYRYSDDSEPLHRGKPASFKRVNEHEGLAIADIDLDGKDDIVGGGRWWKHIGGLQFQENLIDPAYAFTRVAVGQLKAGGRPELVLVIGDGQGPLIWYEWVKGTWIPHVLRQVVNGHSLAVADINGDGWLDIFCAEMRLNGANPNAAIYVFLGDGQGNFKEEVVARGFGVHEGKVADLNGDGLLDILAKPYNWQTPRIDIWLQVERGR